MSHEILGVYDYVLLDRVVHKNRTCLKLKQPTISRNFICLLHKVYGNVISNFWGNKSAKMTGMHFEE